MPNKGEEIIDIEVKLLSDYDMGKAWRVESLQTCKFAWIPKSLAELALVSRGANIGTLTLPTWLARDRELI